MTTEDRRAPWQRLRDQVRSAGPTFGMLFRQPRPARVVDRVMEWAAFEDRAALAEDWQDEASQAAVDGNTARAGYLEHMRGRLLR